MIVADCPAVRADFNPRPPCGGRPPAVDLDSADEVISIHVPRVEDDAESTSPPKKLSNFNPRPPCGGRHKQSYDRINLMTISIHVPRVEDDSDISKD